MLRLRLEQRGGIPLVFDADLITIGRSAGCMVILADSRVSSVHGEIARRDGRYYYRDLGSTNGSLVASQGKETVVDGKRVREARLEHGDELRLGDRTRPVVLRVALEDVADSPNAVRTIMARRLTASAELLGSQIVENPLASRETLSRLFALFAELAQSRSHKDLAERTAARTLDLLARNAFAAVFLRLDDRWERRALVARDPAHVPNVTPEQLTSWFPQVVSGEASAGVELPLPLRERLGNLERLAACPLPGEAGVAGVLLVGRSAAFSEFDVDVLALVGHHVGLQIQRVGLLEQLEAKNQRLADENRGLRNALDASVVVRPMIGESPTFLRVLRQAELVAAAPTHVLILGETGTGKELVARHIHGLSLRHASRFAAVNCASLAETLLESELFGHVRGAFTGADQDRDGLFAAANGGTLFLDEIGEITLRVQAKLLRVLEEGEVMPVGSSRPIRVDVRIIAATHRNLEQEVAEGRFREDLYYRINVFPITLPPLRERRGDIPVLARHFLQKYSRFLGKPIADFDPVALARLEAYAWPGNVRQLENEIHRAVVLAGPNERVTAELLGEEVAGLEDLSGHTGALKDVMSRLEEQYIRRVLREHGDNRTQTARALGISRQALTEKLRGYGLVERRAEPAE